MASKYDGRMIARTGGVLDVGSYGLGEVMDEMTDDNMMDESRDASGKSSPKSCGEEGSRVATDPPQYIRLLPDMLAYVPEFHFEETNTSYSHTGIALAEQTPLKLTVNHLNYVTFTSQGNPIIVSVQKESSKTGTKVLLWLPKKVKRIVVPRPHCLTIKDTLLYVLRDVPHPPKCWNLTKVGDRKFYLGLCEIAEKLTWTNFKFGVLLALPDLVTETELYKNDEMSSNFIEFLEILGTKITLCGWTKYRGGLDIHKNAHGESSYYTNFHGNEIMFHVGPMILQVADDPGRKRHIGNDIVMIIFREQSELLLDLSTVKSHFNHIFVVVEKVSKTSLMRMKHFLGDEFTESLLPLKDTWYHISVVTVAGVKKFLPQLPFPPIIKKEDLREWLLTKCINGERMAINHSKAFSDKISYTRQQLVSKLVNQFNLFPPDAEQKE
eukprot:TRINITY_DN2414_c0_g1_i5.p1 TRINITY_DN2414_c0_g1~~TRINITY_DN2414_c0_g1_i5.p1  ORF type:complete len:438 (-),score=98.49 TRINITY_DN2414_c0_g1_i5:98-1411(-)